MRTGARHVLQRPPAVVRLQIHAAAAVDDHLRWIAGSQRIQYAELDAVVGRQAHDCQPLDALRLQPAVQFGLCTVAVIEERAVAVDVRLLPFAKNGIDMLPLQPG